MGKWANAAAIGVLGILGLPDQGRTAELVVLTNQGAVPGARELAAGFSRISGHKVTVLEETGAALEKRINEGPADLITLNPGAMGDVAKKNAVVANSVTPYMLAGL